MNLSKKLHAFQNIIENEIADKKIIAAEETADSFEAARLEILSEAGSNAEKRFAAERAAAELEKNIKVSGSRATSKKTITKKRENLTDELFSDVSERLSEFVKSPAYPIRLAAAINESKKKLPPGEELIVTLRPEDFHLAGPIKESCGLEIKSGTEDFYGGFIFSLPDSNAIVDESYKTKLADARKNFRTVNVAGDIL